MKKNRIIFYAIFAFFHLFIFFFTLYMDKEQNNFNLLLAMQKKIWMLKYGSFIGLVLLGVDIVWLLRAEKAHEREKQAWDAEMQALKAKLFDLQENEKRNSPLQ